MEINTHNAEILLSAAINLIIPKMRFLKSLLLDDQMLVNLPLSIHC